MLPVTGGKRLLIMRHAKSDRDAVYDSDHERPLSERGVRSARLMGRLLGALDLKPDLVLTSTATRARDTARQAAEAGKWDCPIIEEAGLYGASPDSALAIAATLTNAERVLLVGHEPTWSSLVGRVTGLRTEMKTGTVAVLNLPIGDWSDAPGAEGVLVALHHPRAYFGSEWDQG